MKALYLILMEKVYNTLKRGECWNCSKKKRGLHAQASKNNLFIHLL